MSFIYRIFCRDCKHFDYLNAPRIICSKCGSSNLRRDRIDSKGTSKGCRSCKKKKK